MRTLTLLKLRPAALRMCRAQPALWLVQPIFWGTWATLVSPLIGSLGFAISVWYTTLRRPRITLLLTGIFLLVVWRDVYFLPSKPILIAAHVAQTGTIDNFPLREKPAACPVTTPTYGRALLRLSEGESCPLPGTRVTWYGSLATASEATNPGGFSEMAWLEGQEITAVIQVDSLVSNGQPGCIWRWTLWLRSTLVATFKRYIPEPSQALVISTVLGDMHALSRSTKRDFQNTGMLHILAISGQHIALMAAIGIQTFRLFRLPQRLACLVIALGLGLYGPATGWSPSVVRSIWMFWLVLPALFLRRPMSPWTSFAMATSLSLALDPETLLQVGWQLSYLATLALLLHIKTSEVWADKVLPRLEFPGKVATMLRLSLTASMLSIAVTAATFPLIASSSHVIMPLAPLANLLTVPLGSGLLTSAFLTGAFAPLPLIPSLLGQATGFFAWALATVVHTLALWQGGLIAMPPWPLILGFCWIGIILLWPFMLKREKRFLIFGLVVFVATAWVWQQGHHAVLQPVTAVVLDVGQGQAVLLEINGKAILVDAGPARPDAGLRVILPALRARGWNHLDAVFLSHGDADHIGGLTSLIGELPIGQVVLGGPWAEDGLWPGIEKSLSEHHIPFGPIKSGASILQAGLWHLRILDLKIDPVKSRNDGSAVLVLEGPTGRLVIPGDIGKEPEQILADSVQLWRTAGLKSPLWLVIPHHGSDKTGDTASLVAMHPDVALISVGKKNRYGHPGAHTVAALRGMQIPLFMTHETGAVVLNADIHQAHWASYIQDVD